MAEMRQDRDRVDRILDAALAKHAAVEPRAGLEDRVLANLRAQRRPVLNHLWYRWSALAGVAVLLVVVMSLVWRLGRISHSAVMNYPSAMTPVSRAGSQIVSNHSGNGVRAHEPRGTQRAFRHHTHPLAVMAIQPKLDQFPSPQPLSEEERILASYVAEHPERAVLIAQVISEGRRQDELEEMRAFPSGYRNVNSENSGKTER